MTLVVKLGSSIVAADDGSVRSEVLDPVCDQVGDLHERGEAVVLVTSGAIASGMRVMGRSSRTGSMDELQALSAVGQGPLFDEYERRLVGRGITAAQVLLAAPDVETRAQYVNARATLRKLLAWRVVPVVNENDTTATDEITFGDNDFLAAHVSVLLHARLLVLLSDVEGLHTADPRRDPDARLVEAVDDPAELDGLDVGDRTSAFGSGGMRSKVGAARMATSAGTAVVVCDGTRPGTLAAAAAGEAVGTRFAPRPRDISSFKLWLRHAKPALGRITVDEGASRVLREEGRSLLPVGIAEVEGDFRAGDAVEVVGPDGRTIGKGLTAYTAAELRAIAGLRTERVRELMPHASDEAIHRDQLVLD